jgi:hypothetical protein
MTRRQAFAELSLFLVAALAGVISIGQAFRGTPAWLLITAVATRVLARQMGRVEDSWPRRKHSRPPRAGAPGGHSSVVRASEEPR